MAGSHIADEEDIRKDSQYGCDKSVTGKYSGRYCGALIQSSGWKIPNDYPVKF